MKNLLEAIAAVLMLAAFGSLGAAAWKLGTSYSKGSAAPEKLAKLNTCYASKSDPTKESWESERPTIYKVCIIGKAAYATTICQHEDVIMSCRCMGEYSTKEFKFFHRMYPNEVECPNE